MDIEQQVAALQARVEHLEGIVSRFVQSGLAEQLVTLRSEIAELKRMLAEMRT